MLVLLGLLISITFKDVSNLIFKWYINKVDFNLLELSSIYSICKFVDLKLYLINYIETLIFISF
jgi:hypothetical protein